MRITYFRVGFVRKKFVFAPVLPLLAEPCLCMDDNVIGMAFFTVAEDGSAVPADSYAGATYGLRNKIRIEKQKYFIEKR